VRGVTGSQPVAVPGVPPTPLAEAVPQLVMDRAKMSTAGGVDALIPRPGTTMIDV
jgi:hypothetical protein